MSQETGPEDEQVQAALTMFEQVDIAFGVFRDDGLLIASNTASDRLYGVSREATGCQAALVGIGADIARTMVHIGVDSRGS
jgi:hypothetical protein